MSELKPYFRMNTTDTSMLVTRLFPEVSCPYISYNNRTITKNAHPVLIYIVNQLIY